MPGIRVQMELSNALFARHALPDIPLSSSTTLAAGM
jgi:hypothetical protein